MRKLVISAALLAVASATTVMVGFPDRSARPGVEFGAGDPPDRPSLSPAPDIPPPADAIRVEVGDDLQHLVESNPDGTAFLLASGVHRNQSVRPRHGNRFTGEPGAVLSGAVELDTSAFSREDGRWVIDGPPEGGFVHGEMLPGRERDAHPEDLWADGVRLRHVAPEDLDQPGEWSFDYPSDRVLLFDDPRSVSLLELAITDFAFFGENVRDVTIDNLVVRHYANWAQRGAINGRGSIGWTLTHLDVSSNHAIGIGVGPGMHVHYSRMNGNGQMGIGGPGALHEDSPVDPDEVRPIRVASNEISGNRTLGFDWHWEGGATKFVLTRRLVFANNLVVDNGGPGPWFDIDNLDPVVCANRVEGNVLGIFLEIGYGGRVAWNDVRGNLDPDEPHSSVGILVSSTSDVEIFENAVAGQPDGILGKTNDRGAGIRGTYATTGLHVHDNTVSFERSTGIEVRTGDEAPFETARFARNTWIGPSEEEQVWAWRGRLLDWAAWQEVGQGRDSRLLPSGDVAIPDESPRFTATRVGPRARGERAETSPAAEHCDAALP